MDFVIFDDLCEKVRNMALEIFDGAKDAVLSFAVASIIAWAHGYESKTVNNYVRMLVKDGQSFSNKRVKFKYSRFGLECCVDWDGLWDRQKVYAALLTEPNLLEKAQFLNKTKKVNRHSFVDFSQWRGGMEYEATLPFTFIGLTDRSDAEAKYILRTLWPSELPKNAEHNLPTADKLAYIALKRAEGKLLACGGYLESRGRFVSASLSKPTDPFSSPTFRAMMILPRSLMSPTLSKRGKELIDELMAEPIKKPIQAVRNTTWKILLLSEEGRGMFQGLVQMDAVCSGGQMIGALFHWKDYLEATGLYTSRLRKAGCTRAIWKKHDFWNRVYGPDYRDQAKEDWTGLIFGSTKILGPSYMIEQGGVFYTIYQLNLLLKKLTTQRKLIWWADYGPLGCIKHHMNGSKYGVIDKAATADWKNDPEKAEIQIGKRKFRLKAPNIYLDEGNKDWPNYVLTGLAHYTEAWVTNRLLLDCKYWGIWCIVIHDCIICHPNYADKLHLQYVHYMQYLYDHAEEIVKAYFISLGIDLNDLQVQDLFKHIRATTGLKLDGKWCHHFE